MNATHRQRPDTPSGVTGDGRPSAPSGSVAADDEHRLIFVDRMRWLILAFSLFSVAVLARLFLAQILTLWNRPERVVAQAADTSRGRIVDRNGLLLATDMFIWDIYLSPEAYWDSKNKPTADDIELFAAQIGVPAEALTQALAQEGSYAFVARNVTREQCEIADHGRDIPAWVWCDGRRRRTYPQDSLAAHVVGFADGDQIGLTGSEAFYNNWLRTSGEWPLSQLPDLVEPLPAEWSGVLPSPGGRDLVLHLSAPLQYLVERRLIDALTKYQASSGTIIVMDPRTGGVLAMANWPSYNLNDYASIDSKTLISPAVGALYEPGSVFKLVTFAAGLDSSQITPDSQFEDTGALKVGEKVIRNSQNRRLGWVTARQALAESLNVVSADISLRMAPEVFYRYVRQFGFGKPTEVDLDSEAAGIVNRPGTQFYSRYDQAANSYGQGISVTPLQMINAAAAVANRGTLLQPQIAQALVYDGKMYRLPQRILGQAVRPETAHTLTQMLVYTVDNYNGGPKLVPGYRVAGKTGTAEIPEQEGYTSNLTITSFVGFLPAADPQLVILVKLAEPRSSRWAEQVALPVFGQVARDAVQVMKIAPNAEAP